MPMIEKNVIDKIREENNIIDIIGEYLPLTKRGRNFFAVCPFHDDTNPSLSISPEKQIFKCFVCGEAGNVFNFLMKYKNINFNEALKILGDRVGIHTDIKVEKKVIKENNDYYKMHDVISKYYNLNLLNKNGEEALKYLIKRDINKDLIKMFEIGLSTSEKNLATKLLTEKGYTMENLIKSGLTNKGDYGYYDVFTNRIMFPIHNLDGNIVGFSGRIYKEKDGQTNKYVNTKESPIFKKGEILYNYHNIKDEKAKHKKLIIVEGFMDVIRLASVGIYNSVATMGTAVTTEQIKAIKRLTTNVILSFDGDNAGLDAIYKVGLEFRKNGINVNVIILDNDNDPDSYIVNNGKDAYQKLSDNPASFIEFIIEYLKKGKDLSKITDQALYVNEIMDEVNKLSDMTLKKILIDKIASDIKIDSEILKSKLIDEKRKKETKIKIEDRGESNKYLKAEKNLLYYMFKYPEVIKIYEKNISYLPTRDYRFLANEILYFYKNYGTISSADFITYLEDKHDLINLTCTILNYDFKDEYTKEEINDYIKVLKEYNVDSEIKRLEQEMKKGTDLERKTQLLSKIMELKKGVK